MVKTVVDITTAQTTTIDKIRIRTTVEITPTTETRHQTEVPALTDMIGAQHQADELFATIVENQVIDPVATTELQLDRLPLETTDSSAAHVVNRAIKQMFAGIVTNLRETLRFLSYKFLKTSLATQS